MILKKIKRYDIKAFTGYGNSADWEEEEDPDGEWVKYEDIKHLMKEEDGKEN